MTIPTNYESYQKCQNNHNMTFFLPHKKKKCTAAPVINTQGDIWGIPWRYIYWKLRTGCISSISAKLHVLGDETAYYSSYCLHLDGVRGQLLLMLLLRPASCRLLFPCTQNYHQCCILLFGHHKLTKISCASGYYVVDARISLLSCSPQIIAYNGVWHFWLSGRFFFSGKKCLEVGIWLERLTWRHTNPDIYTKDQQD